MNPALDVLLSNTLRIFNSLAVELQASVSDWQILFEACFSQIIHRLNYRMSLWKEEFRIYSIYL